MSSFFLKNKPKIGKKRKANPPQIKKAPPKKKFVSKASDEDEIDSDEAFNSNDEDNNISVSDKEDETPQDRRLRLAKKYLEEIEIEEKNRAEDKELNDVVTHRLKEEYLDKIGKLRRNVAGLYKGYNDKNLRTLKHKFQKMPPTCVAISSDDQFMFTASKCSYVIKWDCSTFKPIGKFDCQAIPLDQQQLSNGTKRRPNVIALSISSDKKFLAVADGGTTIQIWCPIQLKHLKTFKGHRDVVTCLAFRKDTHELYSGSKDRSVKIWSLDEMAYVESLFGHQAGITGIDALSRERAITSGGTDCSIRIWKISEESQLIYNGHNGSIENVKLINEETFLSSGVDGSLCVWSTLKKKPLCIQPLAHGKSENGEANWITAITALINTDLIASGASDGFIKLWQILDNGKKLKKIFQIPVVGFVNSLVFTNDGKYLIAAVAQEHRLGRWWRCKEAKNSIVVIELEKSVSRK